MDLRKRCRFRSEGALGPWRLTNQFGLQTWRKTQTKLISNDLTNGFPVTRNSAEASDFHTVEESRGPLVGCFVEGVL